MLHQAAMLIIFFIAAVPKTANASQNRCASTNLFYAISFQSVNGKAYRQYGKRTATKMA